MLVVVVMAGIAISYFFSRSSGVVVQRDGLSFAAGPLLAALDSKDTLPNTRILDDFAGPARVPCRIFARADVSGIACREFGGWHLRVQRDGIDVAGNDGAAASAIDRALRADARELAGQR